MAASGPASVFARGVEAYRRNDYPAALEACEQVLEIGAEADSLPAVLNLKALSLVGLGNLIDAIPCLEQAIEVNSLDTRLHLHLAQLLAQLGKHEPALDHADLAARLAANDHRPDYLAAQIFQSMGQLDAAKNSALSSVKKNAANTDGWMLLAELSAEQDKNKEALEYLQPALDTRPLLSRAWAWLAEMEPRLDSGLPVVEKLAQARKEATSPQDFATAVFALADEGRKAGNHQRAFALYREANQRLDSEQPFDIFAWESRVADIIAASTNPGRKSQVSVEESSAAPRLVFILGMPRSGTSLCEQVLSSHPQVHGAGELPTMEYIEACLRQRGINPYGPDKRGWEDEMRQVYLDSLPPLEAGELWVTDKTPRNFERLGLILRLFPGARIVWMLRHPIDTVLSCYFQDFSSSQGFSNRLDHAARVYAGHLRLLAHWKQQFAEHVQVIDYASLVQELQSTARGMADFMGLDFHPAMLQPHRNPRVVRTASAEQVRQPVYTEGLGRWQTYAGELGELLSQMQALGLVDDKGDMAPIA